MNDVQPLFAGLTEAQARRFRKAIIPALHALREQIIAADTTGKRPARKQRLRHGPMQSEDTLRKAV